MARELGRFTSRVAKLKEEGAYAVLAQAQTLEAEGRDIVHLEIGQPDFATFSNVSLAGIRAIAGGRTRYNPPSGIPSLRAAIAEDAGRRRGIQFTPEEVVVGPGAKPLLYFPILALVEPGDEVVYPDPGFPSYRAIIEVAGGRPVPVPLSEETQFSFDLDAFDAAVGPRTRLIIINSPSNPTGGIIPYEDLKHILQTAERYNCWIMSDEIYMRIVYGTESVGSIAALPGARKRTLIVDGFSKTFAMTGWRLGFGIMPTALAHKIGLLLTHSVGCTASFTQHAGLEAIIGPQSHVDAACDLYRKRRDFVVNRLNAIAGIRCLEPQGAFYVFPNIEHFQLTSEDMAAYLLDAAGVAVLPGTAFGDFGEGYLRICYANSIENLDKALTRIENSLALL
jgi:aspartate aminotransferase